MVGIVLAASMATGGWRLVWSDEFSIPGKPDSLRWTYERGFVRNKELQWYQPDNARVENGRLIIEGRRESVPNPNYVEGSDDWRKNRKRASYTSASVTTRGLFSWLYGRLEVRARIVPEVGLWPAIWTLGIEKGWPSNGEVDVMEFYQNTILANVAWGTGGGVWNTQKHPYPEFVAKDPNWASKFHTWVMEWDEESIRLLLDGQILNNTDTTKTLNPDGFNPFRQPHYLILNLAIGSTGGDPGTTRLPTRYEIDYVRVFRRVDD